jgi:hypothetical protein
MKVQKYCPLKRLMWKAGGGLLALVVAGGLFGAGRMLWKDYRANNGARSGQTTTRPTTQPTTMPTSQSASLDNNPWNQPGNNGAEYRLTDRRDYSTNH